MRTCGCLLGHRDPMAALSMDVDELDADACRSAIARSRRGRLVYTHREVLAGPYVDYLDLGDRLLLSVAGDSELIAELPGHVVTLFVEHDYEKYLRHSVLVTGLCLPLGSGDAVASEEETACFSLNAPLLRGRRSRIR